MNYKKNNIIHYKEMNMNKPLFISLEGNIGAGKSTILKNLEKYLENNNKYIFLKEPVHLWEQIKDEDGKTMLAKFYENPVKYAFPFQIMAFTTRYQELKRILNENPNVEVVICERSLEADKNIFAKMLHDDKVIDSVMYQIYEQYFSEYEGNFSLSGLVYLRASPETCLKRVHKRNREGESLRLDYLSKCHDYHETWMKKTQTPTCILNVEDDACNMEKWIKEVIHFTEQRVLMEKKEKLEKNIHDVLLRANK